MKFDYFSNYSNKANRIIIQLLLMFENEKINLSLKAIQFFINLSLSEK